jgi:hypothetical protein
MAIGKESNDPNTKAAINYALRCIAAMREMEYAETNSRQVPTGLHMRGQSGADEQDIPF